MFLIHHQTKLISILSMWLTSFLKRILLIELHLRTSRYVSLLPAFWNTLQGLLKILVYNYSCIPGWTSNLYCSMTKWNPWPKESLFKQTTYSLSYYNNILLYLWSQWQSISIMLTNFLISMMILPTNGLYYYYILTI